MDKEDVGNIHIHTYTHTHTHVCVSIWTTTLPIVRRRMDTEGTTLNEISQMGKTNIVWYHLYVESKNYSKQVNITKKKQTHSYREQTSGYQWGEGKEEG